MRFRKRNEHEEGRTSANGLRRVRLMFSVSYGGGQCGHLVTEMILDEDMCIHALYTYIHLSLSFLFVYN